MEFLQRLRKSTFYQFRTENSYEKKIGSGKPPSFRQLLLGFRLFTTLHGVPQIGSAGGNSKRVLWLCVFLACVCGFTYNLSMLILRYREFLVLTEIHLLHNNTLPFPAVTICNTNPIRSSQVHRSERLVALLESWGLVVENGTVRRFKRETMDTAVKHDNNLQLDGPPPAPPPNAQSMMPNESSNQGKLNENTVHFRDLMSNSGIEQEMDWDHLIGLGARKDSNLPSNTAVQRTKRDSESCIDSCVGQVDGNYQACDSCTQYFQCFSSNEYKMSCAAGTQWDSGVNGCVFSSTTCPVAHSICRWVAPEECLATFVYRDVTYEQCTNQKRPWCSEDYNYNDNWHYCAVECQHDATYECTWSPSSRCVLPFTYQSMTYHQCTNMDEDVHWCSHDAVYQDKWSHCEPTCEETGSSDPCLSHACGNGGTCSVVDGSAECTCTEQFAGDDCEQSRLGTISLVREGSMTQQTAKAACRAHGDSSYRLADIESEEELQTIMSNFQCTDGFSQAWVGLERVAGTWTWIQDGRPAFQPGQWSFWGGIEPDNDEDCARIRYSDGGFGDRTCDYHQYSNYFCEGDFQNPCDPNPCQNGGTCCVIEFVAACSCPADFEGDLCQTEPSRGYAEYQDQGCSSSTVEEFSVRSSRECSWQCNLRSECEAYVFSRRSRVCTLQLECEVENLVPAVDQTTYITTGAKVTHTIFRAARGSSTHTQSPVLYDLWNSQDPLPSLDEPMDSSYIDLTEASTQTFKSPIVDCAWDKVEMVKASFYTGGEEVMFLLFNASGVDKMSWFSDVYLTDSSFTDLMGATSNHFSITGHASSNLEKRRWYISNLFASCSGDQAWAIVLDSDHKTNCDYENYSNNPTFLYSASGTRTNSFSEAEIFIIEAQLNERDFGDSCVSSCHGAADGLYQSCLGCDVYLSCTSDILQYHTCEYGLLYDNGTKQCSNVSSTCTGSSAYGVCLKVLPSTETPTTTIQDTTQADTTTILETTVADTTTILETTVADTTTILETTVADTTTVLESTVADTTTILETTVADTTTILESTVADTTTVLESTVADTTTILETTVADTTTILETTVGDATTTLETTVADTTTVLETTVADTTTILESTVPSMTTVLRNTIINSSEAESTSVAYTTTKITGHLSSSVDSTLSVTSQTQMEDEVGSTRKEPISSSSVGGDELTEEFQRHEELMKILAEMDESQKRDIGYKDSMILSCLYEGQGCTENDFTSFFDAVFGTCYVYNSGWQNQSSALVANKPGSRYGLTIIVDIGQEEYLPIIGQAAGVVVVVHKRTEMPFPEEEGVFAMPGKSTEIAVRMVDIHRKPAPFSDCTEDVRQNMSRNVYEELYTVEYNTYACYKTCYQRHVVGECQCGDPQYPIKGLAFGDNEKACDIRNHTQRECKERIIGQYNSGTLECDCPTPCHREQFKYIVSSILWPSDVHKDNIQDLLTDKLELFDSGQSDLSNLVKVQVYFENFNYKYMNEKPKFWLLQLFTGIGGIIGLWLGCSILSILELLEFGIDFIVLTVYRCKFIPYWAQSFWKVDTPPAEKTTTKTASSPTCEICKMELGCGVSDLYQMGENGTRWCLSCKNIPISPTSTEISFADIAAIREEESFCSNSPSTSGIHNSETSIKTKFRPPKRRQRKVTPEVSHGHKKGITKASCTHCTSYWRNKEMGKVQYFST